MGRGEHLCDDCKGRGANGFVVSAVICDGPNDKFRKITEAYRKDAMEKSFTGEYFKDRDGSQGFRPISRAEYGRRHFTGAGTRKTPETGS